MSDWVSQPLTEDHDVSQFGSGNASLDRWQWTHSALTVRASRARPSGQRPATAPSSGLLLDALERIVDAANRAGGRVIVVDAIDDTAHRFYRHHGFHAVEHRTGS